MGGTKEGVREALQLFYKAIELDPDFASAYGMAAYCYVQRKANLWMGEGVQEIAEAARLARRAVDLGADDAVALCTAGIALAVVVHDLDGGSAFIDQALALNPNLAMAWQVSGWVKAFLAEPEAAINQLARTMRLSPLDPLSFRAQGGIAFAHFLAGRYDEASLWAERAWRQRPNYLPAVPELAAANALAGRLFEAQKTMGHLRQLAPTLRQCQGLDPASPTRRSCKVRGQPAKSGTAGMICIGDTAEVKEAIPVGIVAGEA